jgi:hypothetical protein
MSLQPGAGLCVLGELPDCPSRQGLERLRLGLSDNGEPIQGVPLERDLINLSAKLHSSRNPSSTAGGGIKHPRRLGLQRKWQSMMNC